MDRERDAVEASQREANKPVNLSFFDDVDFGSQSDEDGLQRRAPRRSRG